MKKIIVSAMLLMGLSAQAYDYSYLVIEKTDGTSTSLNVESLTFTVSGSQLVATNASGSQTFTLSDLSKMFFSDGSTTDAIKVVQSSTTVKREYYDLRGRRLPSEPSKGMFIVKTEKGTFKVTKK